MENNELFNTAHCEEVIDQKKVDLLQEKLEEELRNEYEDILGY